MAAIWAQPMTSPAPIAGRRDVRLRSLPGDSIAFRRMTCRRMTCRRNTGRRNTGRRGVSLLEVVFAIGVVMVGLLGIAALLPVAGVLANKGAVADSAANMAATAIRDFEVRGMGQPRNWRWHNPTLGPPQFVNLLPTPGQSFCLDPRFAGAANRPDVRNKFPYNVLYDNTLLWMPRFSLAPFPGAANSLFMGRLQAEQVFSGRDDLVFDLPDDRTLGPIQNFGNLLAKRQVEGRISWMATVVPKLDRLGTPTDEYTMSIVVFARRQIDEEIPRDPANPFVGFENYASERVVVASSFFSGQPAFGGGDVQLATRAGRPAGDLELRGGDWVMLSSVKLTAVGTVQVHKWYRVISAGEDPIWDTATGRFFREVTLTGPDWDWGHMGTNTPLNYATPTQVTIVRRVVAVFEKTVRLELSSLWTN